MVELRGFRFPFTSAAIVLFLIVLTAALITDIDVITLPPAVLGRITQGEVDEVLLVFVLIAVAFGIDQTTLTHRMLKQEAQLQEERLRVVHVTMRTVDDVVNNCLNQLQLLRLDAEGHVPTESLLIFDRAIRETSQKLRALGDLPTYVERQMGIGTGLQTRVESVSN